MQTLWVVAQISHIPNFVQLLGAHQQKFKENHQHCALLPLFLMHNTQPAQLGAQHQQQFSQEIQGHAPTLLSILLNTQSSQLSHLSTTVKLIATQSGLLAGPVLWLAQD